MTAPSNKVALARSSPAGLAWYASGGRWIPADHLRLLNRKIVDAAAGRCPRLMVFMPPRHGKSELVSRYTPPWFLGRFPDKKVMLASYADTFAASWGRRSRDVYRELGPRVFGQRVNPETAGGQSWEILGREGIMVTAGVGGGLTGKGADLLIIDDPVKNNVDAASQTIQESHIDWWKSTARTRLMPGAAVILVMTRWHEADLAGRLIRDWLDEDGDAWEILSLPGIAEENCQVSYPDSKHLQLGPDPLGRAPGVALWPQFFDLPALEATRRAQGAYWFNAMYQQRPSSAEGNHFKRADFRYYERHDDGLVTLKRDGGPLLFDTVGFGRRFCTVDTAASEKTSADYTVCSTWIISPEGDLLLWAREREQFEGPEVKALIKRVFWAEKPSIMYVEKAGISMTIIQELIREGLPIIELIADTDKMTRALPMMARYQEHRVYHPMPHQEPWVSAEWEPELLNFPNALHDDQVDTAAYAGIQLPMLAGGIGAAVSRSLGGSGHTMTGGLMAKKL